MVSTSLLNDEKEKILSEGSGVPSNRRKFDLILLYFGQRQTQLSNQPSKLISIKGML